MEGRHSRLPRLTSCHHSKVTADFEVPPPEFWLTHLSDSEFEALVHPLHSPADVSRPWLESALVHPSYLRDLDSQFSLRDPPAVLLRGMAVVLEQL